MRFSIPVFALCSFLFIHSGKAQPALPDSLSRFNSLPHDSNYVIQLNEMAMKYLSISTEASRAITEHTAQVSRTIGFTRGYARALTVTGNSYWYDGIYDLAQSFYLTAARQYESIGDSIGLGQTYNNIGEVYKRMKDYEKSLHYLLLAHRLKREDPYTRAITLYNIGEAYLLISDIRKAIDYFEQSLSLALKNNEQRVIAYNYWGLARVAYRQKNYKQSVDYYDWAEKIIQSLGDNRLLIEINQDKSDLYRDQKRFKEAELCLDQARNLLAIRKGTDLLATNFLKYAMLDSARGNYGSAMRNLYRYHTLKDSLFSLLKTEQINRLQLVYETEVRNRENSRLRAEKQLQESKMRTQQTIIIAISAVLLLVIVLSWFLYSQHKKIRQANQLLTEKNDQISLQKEAIETQAVALAKLNSALQELNKTLEYRIEERTHELSLKNQKLVEYAFLNAHKLRAPISSILGLINLLEQELAQDTPLILGYLKDCGRQLDAITREISRQLDEDAPHSKT
jgi:hypothetical protein